MRSTKVSVSNRNNRYGSQIGNLIPAGLFAALTGVCAWINIPLFFTPIPLNLALIGPILAGLLLGYKFGTVSQLIYILIGITGLPVFAGFTAGIGILLGPTGGFLTGYLLCAFICGLPCKRKTVLLTSGVLACYCLGLLWFVFSGGSSLATGFVSCILPFIPGDILKIVLSMFIYSRTGSRI